MAPKSTPMVLHPESRRPRFHVDPGAQLARVDACLSLCAQAGHPELFSREGPRAGLRELAADLRAPARVRTLLRVALGCWDGSCDPTLSELVALPDEDRVPVAMMIGLLDGCPRFLYAWQALLRLPAGATVLELPLPM